MAGGESRNASDWLIAELTAVLAHIWVNRHISCLDRKGEGPMEPVYSYMWVNRHTSCLKRKGGGPMEPVYSNMWLGGLTEVCVSSHLLGGKNLPPNNILSLIIAN